MSKLYIETYGCQMNFADSEIVASLLQKSGHTVVADIEEADYVLINTCAIRDNAEQRIRKRLRELRALQGRHRSLRIGILGCMAERLQSQLMVEEENVSFVVGPDAYRRLPEILERVRQTGTKAAETELSTTETYADIEPVRLGSNGISVGQNVNSYRFQNTTEGQPPVDFPELMHRVASISPLLRVRFATSHPKDLSDSLLEVMASHSNICKCIHLPVQSGSDRMLKLMNRHYDAAWYLDRIEAIRHYMPDCSITTDVIAGFCTETEEEHQMTLDMFRKVRYDYAYMFKFSMRPDTYAAKHLQDDIPDDEKTRRLEEIIALQGQIALENNRKEVGKTFEVLVEGESHRSKEQLFGRNSQNKVIVFDRLDAQPGQYINVKVTDCTAATLKGEIVP